MAKNPIPKCGKCGKYLIPLNKIANVRPDQIALVCKCEKISLDQLKNEPSLSEEDVVEENFDYLDRLEEKRLQDSVDNLVRNKQEKASDQQKNSTGDQLGNLAKRRKQIFEGFINGSVVAPSKPFAAFLALFVWPFGSHRWYVGDKEAGQTILIWFFVSVFFSFALIGLLGLLILWIYCLVDAIKILSTSEKDWLLKYGQLLTIDEPLS